MDLKQIQYFIALFEDGSVTRAAKRLDVAALVLVGGLIGIAAKATKQHDHDGHLDNADGIDRGGQSRASPPAPTTSFNSRARSAMVCRDAVASPRRCPD